MTWRAVIRIGRYGSWSKGGFKTRLGAKAAALKMMKHWIEVQPDIDIRVEEPERENP